MLPANYQQLKDELSKTIPVKRIITNPLQLLAYGTDASFYRLIPKIVVQVHTEEEAVEVIRQTGRLNLPVTYRAAGTSLSGQAISDSVLMVATHEWRKYTILDDDGMKIDQSCLKRAEILDSLNILTEMENVYCLLLLLKGYKVVGCMVI